MKKALPIGKDNFKKLIEEECYYVDKTKVIEELIQNKSEIVLFPRPRRFGKSLFISMLEHFFDIDRKEDNKNLFEELNISKSPVYEENRGKYPVINLDFKDIKSETFESLLYDFKSQMSRIYMEKKYILDTLIEEEKEYYQSMISKKATLDEYKESLVNLSMWLERYYKEKTIILIDEYDTPMESGRNYGYYDEIMKLIRPMFSKAFKGNDSLKMGVLTGVLRIGGESLFSDFNNPDVYDIMTPGYNEYFGFTEKETKELLEYYDLELTSDVKEYYDGYNFNGISIYNPWSIINYAKKQVLMPYWVNTSSNNLIKEILKELNEEEKQEIERIILGESIEFDYNPKLSYTSLTTGLGFSLGLNLLLVSGYLTLDREEETRVYYRIPNKEVKKDFGSMLEYILFNQDAGARPDLKRFIQGLEENNKELAEENLNKIIKSVSYHDSKENFYHGYLLGLLNSFIKDNSYIVTSNPESGYGRADIIIKKKDKSLGIVIEFKVAKKASDMEKTAESAINQMNERNYRQTLEGEDIKNIYQHAIVFHGKKCIVR